MRRRDVFLLIPWLLGFFLVFDLYLLPSADLSPRLTDVLGVALSLWLLWWFSSRGVHVGPLVALLIGSAIPLMWGLNAFSTGDLPTATISVRWLLAIPWAFALFYMARNPRQRTSVAWGLWWGCVANVGVLLLQYYGFEQLTLDLGLAAQDSLHSSFGSADRLFGMHAHPNGSSAVVSLIVPIGLYLYYVSRTRAWTILVGLGLLMFTTQLTLTRSSLLVSSITILTVFVVFFVVHPSLRRSLRLVAVIALVVLPTIYWFGLPGGAERWQEVRNIEASSSQRLLSNAGALQVSSESPLGRGVDAGKEAMRKEAGGTVTHNAFLHIAVVYGPLLAGLLTLWLLFLTLQLLRGLKTTWLLEAMLALHLFGLFFWEQYLTAPTFIILTSWLIAASMTCMFASLRRRSPAGASPYYQHLDRQAFRATSSR